MRTTTSLELGNRKKEKGWVLTLGVMTSSPRAMLVSFMISGRDSSWRNKLWPIDGRIIRG